MEMFNPILDGGFIAGILQSLGLVTDFEVTDIYTYMYSIFLILVALLFVAMFLRVLFRCIASFFQGVGL